MTWEPEKLDSYSAPQLPQFHHQSAEVVALFEWAKMTTGIVQTLGAEVVRLNQRVKDLEYQQ